MPARHSPSDSDSEYGSRSKKKKKARSSGDEIRVSSRGGKIPNYIDDVQDFGQFEDEDTDSGYYADPNIQYKEEDEIEAVLSHTRDEGREHDGEDLWFDNVVRIPVHMTTLLDQLLSVNSASISSGKISRIYTTQTKHTNS